MCVCFFKIIKFIKRNPRVDGFASPQEKKKK